MRTKDEYYQLVLENRRLAADPVVTNCTCTQSLCEWHGRCKECVALHRYHKDHVPACFHEMINDKLKAVAKIGELTATENTKTPHEYRLFVKEQDNLRGSSEKA